MNSTYTPNPSRIDQLMVDAATQGLSPQDAATLRDAIDRDPALSLEAEAYELAATAIELALFPVVLDESPPATLRDKLMQSATQHQRMADTAGPLRLTGSAADRPTKAKFSWTDGRFFGWYAAAAALIALGLVLYQPQASNQTPTYEQLAALPSTVKADWGFNSDAGDKRFANAKGQVIWNSTQQTGYMKLAGLPINDPTVEQYQLWIVDPARDAEPIDGGVFNITAQGEVIIPIDAKLRSDSPAVFAITIEKPGGVVVSQGPLQVVAAVPSAG